MYSAPPAPGCYDGNACVRAGVVPGPKGVRSRLSYYRPGLRQREHTHHAPHFSVVIAGSFQESTCCAERIICHGSVGFRADAARHAVHYGPAGALILSIDVDTGILADPGRDGVRWLHAPASAARDLLVPLDARPAEAVGAALERLLALAAARHGSVMAMPVLKAPAWLRRAAERLIVAPQTLRIAELSRWCGVHRAHLACEFLRHYGMSPSRFRRRAMTARSLGAALGPDSSLAGAADAGGFADQSHMTRAMRECCGLSPGRIRRLLKQATSVQYAVDPAA